MNTRSISDKEEVNKLYKTAVENKNKSKVADTPYTSTPIPSSSRAPKIVNLFAPTAPVDNLSDFDDSGDVTIKPKDNSECENSTLTSNEDIKESNIMAQGNPFATLKYAVDAVPFFDGKNIPLSYFIEGCEEAKSMLPSEAEPQFAKIIRTRIVGEARRTISDQDFENVAALTKYLKQIYGGTKNVYQLQGELGNVYQKNNEDVVTYANRVKLLGKQILEAYRSSGHGLPDESIRTSLEKDMCKCFIRGLTPEIEQRIARNLNVERTVADALRIERELRDMTDLRYGSANSGQNKASGNSSLEVCQICLKVGHSAVNCRRFTQQANSFQLNHLGTEITICQISNKRGHSADRCRLRDPQARQSVNVLQENMIKCQLCTKIGHNAKNCRLNRSTNQNINYNNSRTSVVCQWCDRPGHAANNCWKKQSEQLNTNNQFKVMCQICNKIGHIAKNCRSNSNQTNLNQEGESYCRYCKEKGHLLANCQLRIASNNRRKENNPENRNGPSRSGVPQGSAQASRPSAT